MVGASPETMTSIASDALVSASNANDDASDANAAIVDNDASSETAAAANDDRSGAGATNANANASSPQRLRKWSEALSTPSDRPSYSPSVDTAASSRLGLHGAGL